MKKDKVVNIESARSKEKEPDFDHYLEVMSTEAKAALAGLVRSAELLRELNSKAIVTGRDPLTFNTTSKKPGKLLGEIFDNVAVVSADMEAVEDQQGI